MARPWPGVIESVRIRIVPSLTSYQLILSAPEGHHRKEGAILVGNPCLRKLKKPLGDLPCSQEEVEMIASILNTIPLIGRQATKAEVMKRMSSVGLIHMLPTKTSALEKLLCLQTLDGRRSYLTERITF